MRPWPLVVLALASGACVPFAAPPLRVDVGGAYNTGRSSAREKMSVGAHLASAWHDPNLPLDIGFGYVRNGFASHDGPESTGVEGAASVNPVHATPRPRRAVPQGFYLEAGPRIAGGESWRAFVSSRVEMYAATQSQLVGVGFLARASAEVLYSVQTQPVAGVDRKGVFFGVANGVLALAAYAEAGYQRWPTGETGAVIGIGLSARLPGVIGVACCYLGKDKK